MEPLRNLPLAGDLVVGASFARMLASSMSITRTAETDVPLGAEGASEGALTVRFPDRPVTLDRFENCLKCGICISACPTMATDQRFRGPAMLAAVARARQESADAAERERLLDLVDGEHGVWRCHSTWECTERCPQYCCSVCSPLHMIANHFVVEGGLRSYAEVGAYLRSPVIFALEHLFLVTATLHAMLGVRAVLFDFGLQPATERRVTAGLVALGTASIVYGVWLLWVVAY